MGFFFASGAKTQVSAKARPSDELLHQLECRACPLNKARLHSPKMLPSGDDEPLIYVLGEAPGRTEDDEGEQFVGASGDFLRPLIPRHLRKQIRWNNTIRCWPGEGNPTPDKVQVECCRPSIERDIEDSRPVAIFGMGATALSWAGKPSGIGLWRGRRFPMRVGSHTCWYYPMFHPSHLLQDRKDGWRKSDDEVAFGFDIAKALREVEEGLPRPIVHTAKMARENTMCVRGSAKGDLADVLDFLDYAATADVAGVDYETSHLRPYRKGACILTKAVSVENETLAFAWRHREAGWTPEQLQKLQKAWIRFLLSKTIKAVHNLSFEMEWTCVSYADEGVDLARDVPWQDSQTQAYVLDERVGEVKPGAIALEFITLENFGLNIKELTRGLNKEKMAQEPLHVLLPYNGIDSRYHLWNYVLLAQRIKDQGLEGVYQEKLDQVPTTVLAQIKGMPIDPEENEKLSREFGRRLAQADEAVQALPEARQFRKMTGQKFNPNAREDIIVVLRDILKTRKGQTGTGWSTTETVLNDIGGEFCKATLAYKKVRKLKSTYIDPMSPGGEDLYDGSVLHTNLGTTFTETGRLQSDSPNLQNIPIRTEEGRKVRRQFRRKKGVVMSVDYGQIDARVIACGSRDKAYCKALWEDYDIHMGWAKRLAKYHPDWVGGKKFIEDEKALKEFRSGMVKNKFVFALFYGAALHTTAGRFGVDDDFMRPQYEKFWEQFAGVKVWQNDLISLFDERGYVQLLGGQRRRAPLGRGQIINTPVQNGTNRIVMDAMNRLSATGDPLLQANLQIHDDLLFFFEREADYWDAAPIIIDTMLDGKAFPWFCVPLVVEMKEGNNWQDMVEVGAYNSVKRLDWPVRAPEFM